MLVPRVCGSRAVKWPPAPHEVTQRPTRGRGSSALFAVTRRRLALPSRRWRPSRRRAPGLPLARSASSPAVKATIVRLKAGTPTVVTSWLTAPPALFDRFRDDPHVQLLAVSPGLFGRVARPRPRPIDGVKSSNANCVVFRCSSAEPITTSGVRNGRVHALGGPS
jgi:hypothetical protein